MPERWGGREALVGKSASCSSKGPEVCSQHPCQQRLKVAHSTYTHVVCSTRVHKHESKGKKTHINRDTGGDGKSTFVGTGASTGTTSSMAN